MIERVGVAVVVEGACLGPAVAEVAGGQVSNSRWGFELGVELAGVDGRGVGWQPESLLADLLVGGVKQVFTIDGHHARPHRPVRLARSVIQ